MNDDRPPAGSAQPARLPKALQERGRVIPYPPIEQHGVIGDRRTAALVASDGTLDWLCLPNFDGDIIFGGLLDRLKGGYWRLGPANMTFGKQSYWDEAMVLETRWESPEGALLLHEAMLWPENKRAPEQTEVRSMVRVLRCVRGRMRCEMDLQAGCNFEQEPAAITPHQSGFTIQIKEISLRLWTNHPAEVIGSRLHQVFELSEGQELWAVLEVGAAGHGWTVESARDALESTAAYWRKWAEGMRSFAVDHKMIRRTGLAVHLLTYAPEGSVVAAPTTSLPERIGGGWNVDYRLCWVRDASLSVGMLARLGNLQETEKYLQWLLGRLSRFGQPLQVLYGIRGEKRPRQRKLSEVAGYKNSAPVRVGNHAYKQHQLGSYGYLADCVWIYLQEGGQWREEYWKLISRLADYTVGHWERPENGIWELPETHHYIDSKVLSWVTLDRAIQIAGKVNAGHDTSSWEAARGAIHAEVMEKGWSENLGAFRQHYDSENLDAATLLISVMAFLSPDHPRVLATMERIAEFLSIDDFVFRFDPMETPGLGKFPLGQLEGAFFPSTFWLATAYAKAGKVERAELILKRAESIAGPLGLFSEAIDPRTRTYLGNTPLLFSHVEYVRAKLEVDRVRGGSKPSQG